MKKVIKDLEQEENTKECVNPPEPKFQPKLLYTAKEIAEITGCNIGYINKLLRCGQIPYLKLGSRKVKHEWLVEFLERNKYKDLTDPENVTDIEIKKY